MLKWNWCASWKYLSTFLLFSDVLISSLYHTTLYSLRILQQLFWSLAHCNTISICDLIYRSDKASLSTQIFAFIWTRHRSRAMCLANTWMPPLCLLYYNKAIIIVIHIANFHFGTMRFPHEWVLSAPPESRSALWLASALFYSHYEFQSSFWSRQ